jgi:hypothetical protein
MRIDADPIEAFPCPNGACDAILKPPPCSCVARLYRPHNWRLECPECGAEFEATWRYGERTQVVKVLYSPATVDPAAPCWEE